MMKISCFFSFPLYLYLCMCFFLLFLATDEGIYINLHSALLNKRPSFFSSLIFFLSVFFRMIFQHHHHQRKSLLLRLMKKIWIAIQTRLQLLIITTLRIITIKMERAMKPKKYVEFNWTESSCFFCYSRLELKRVHRHASVSSTKTSLLYSYIHLEFF